MLKRILTLGLCLVLLITSVACSKRNTVKYPRDMNLDDFVAMDFNLAWLQTYENYWKKENHMLLYTRYYYGIVDVPVEDFQACIYPIPGLGGGTMAVVYVNRNNKVCPIQDWEVDYAELLVIRDTSGGHDDPDWVHWGTYCVKKFFVTVDSDTSVKTVDGIRECRDNPDKRVGYNSDNHLFQFSWGEGEGGGLLSIRIHFKKYENIVWDASLMECNGNYFITCYTGVHHDGYYVPVPDKLVPYIEDSIAQSDWQYVG